MTAIENKECHKLNIFSKGIGCVCGEWVIKVTAVAVC